MFICDSAIRGNVWLNYQRLQGDGKLLVAKADGQQDAEIHLGDPNIATPEPPKLGLASPFRMVGQLYPHASLSPLYCF